MIVAGKQKKLTELKRPIQHLIPVECKKESGKSDAMNRAVTTPPAGDLLEKACQRVRGMQEL